MKTTILILLNIFIGLLLTGQDLNIQYECYSKHPQIDDPNIPILSGMKNKYRYSLKIKSNYSIFSRDSLMLVEAYAQNAFEVWCTEQIYKNYKTDEWLQISGQYVDGFGYLRKISELTANNKFQWKSTNKTKLICDFVCLQVESGNKIAWYAKEIPIADGPKFGIFGLPGLVLEYEDPSGHWVAKSVSFYDLGKIELPNVQTTKNESQIKLSVYDLKELSAEKAIKISSNTPINKWVTFNHQ